MTYLKLGKKLAFIGSSSVIQSKKLDGSSSLAVESNSGSVISNEVQLEPAVMQGKKSILFHNKDIDDLLECPVCSNSMFPPIQQCPSGHTICSECKNRVNNRCPICRKEIGDIRCLALEKLAIFSIFNVPIVI
ncbi:hypothetical protein HPP92_016035 [Vanilla planifolia]|uniref:RING-type domain-containing protein n=1 Tax=Vanilla planifolia TaxID=51239 RepID=A0A835UQ40_VANPL|nr:hypothetical protein HPP92_016035 [Vanilla planifolia]